VEASQHSSPPAPPSSSQPSASSSSLPSLAPVDDLVNAGHMNTAGNLLRAQMQALIPATSDMYQQERA
jgi:hypothetical protein